MAIFVRPANLDEIDPLRESYRSEMNCQIIHDSIHHRHGWSKEFAVILENGALIGYGSVAVAGPWQERPALYEFFLDPEHRMRSFDAFSSLLPVCEAATIETQSNDPALTVMLHAFATNVQAESILFEDGFQTVYAPQGASFRAAEPADVADLLKFELDDTAAWVATLNHEIVGAGGVLYHYNRPYGDVYMKIAEPFRQMGLGAYLVQELKQACRKLGNTPAARCGVDNILSRKTLQKAGFIPCGALITGDLPVGL